MKQLFITISWLEFIRSKTRSLLLLIIILAFSFSLSTCDGSGVSIRMSSQTTHPTPGSSLIVPDNSMRFELHKSIFAAIPAVIITAIAITLGLIVLMTIPFRGREEWENGQFQMIAMGDYSFYIVEFARFLSYLLLATLFFLIIQVCFSAYSWNYDIFTTVSIINIQWIFAYRFASFIPLMLAFGVLVSAINTAYYRDGTGKILVLVKYLSCFSFFVLVMKTALWFEDPAHNLLPAMQAPVEIPGVRQIIFNLNWEFLLLSLATTALFIFWSGRILEEVEA